MSDSYKNSKSNYDRWKPGTKLACMMTLKAVCQDSKFYDSANNRFNSLTWHTVAENLNNEYPDYAKRFTNINVKDRYDRVLKHHKVFRKMANKRNGFVWNPKNFCFDLNELLIKQYENDQNSNIQTGLGDNRQSSNASKNKKSSKDPDAIVPNELNVVRFLSKPGHIDLEYYHRYIYQFLNQQEFRDDVVVSTPSYIEDAISKGILNIVNKPNFSVKSEYDQNQFGDTTSPLMLQQHSHSGSVTSNATNSSSSIPLLSNTSAIPSQSSMSSNSSSLVPQASASMIPTTVPHGSQNHPSQHQHIHPHQQHPHPHPHPHPVLQHPQHPQNDLDFTGLMAQQQGVPNIQHQHPHPTTTQQMHPIIPPPLGQPLMNPMVTDPNLIQRTSMGEPFFKKPKISPQNSSNQINTANFIGAGFNYDTYESMMGAGGQGTTNDSTTTHTPLQAPNSTLQDNLDHQPPSNSAATNSTSNTNGSNTDKISPTSSINGLGSSSIIGLSSGEAILKIHKEFSMMKNVVNEQVLNLRIGKLISHEEFEKIQLVINSNDQFIRSAYKRLNDDNKLVELINIYLNNLE
ncbi:Serine/threonine-protein kinase [Wickerhamomyces ciferrii]|uniref:Serine/threonine-protein kinase n=1 Tax=Wickerhamomyces ciferrii (strain ATCC 14091 / BCRC 22168 / CBS 111 / JCM 3599 / NBRC 0793 / NRRL Y-1031 F-60-10) TaxID=1206466 RepID=K0KV89_WICCF|nr:Serine/threonine-protein kinase [Wickerhamomyces ciferrii]CCH47151.1 Serine/threonine-protein kinase [Wickerhamomyces ciferrii]